jgi:hypothetical protein
MNFSKRHSTHVGCQPSSTCTSLCRVKLNRKVSMAFSRRKDTSYKGQYSPRERSSVFEPPSRCLPSPSLPCCVCVVCVIGVEAGSQTIAHGNAQTSSQTNSVLLLVAPPHWPPQPCRPPATPSRCFTCQNFLVRTSRIYRSRTGSRTTLDLPNPIGSTEVSLRLDALLQVRRNRKALTCRISCPCSLRGAFETAQRSNELTPFWPIHEEDLNRLHDGPDQRILYRLLPQKPA